MELSIVVPIYNEEENVRLLHERVASAMAESGIEFELILVDDGSSDGSFPLLQELAGQDRLETDQPGSILRKKTQ